MASQVHINSLNLSLNFKPRFENLKPRFKNFKVANFKKTLKNVVVYLSITFCNFI